MAMLPINCNATVGASSETGFLLFLLSRSAPLLKPLPRILNQSKKRQSPARFGRYLGLIAAQERNAPALVAVKPSGLAGIFQFVEILATIDRFAVAKTPARHWPALRRHVGAFWPH